MIKSIMQTEKECYMSRDTQNLHKHHIYGGANRHHSEKWGCWVYLRADLHNLSNEGVHFDKELDTRLKQECQKIFIEKYSQEKFMEIFGRNYI